MPPLRISDRMLLMVGSETPRRTRLPTARLTVCASSDGSRKMKPCRSSQIPASSTMAPTSATSVITTTVTCDVHSCQRRLWRQRTPALIDTARRLALSEAERRVAVAHAWRGGELIAHTPDRLNSVAQRTEFLAKPKHVSVDGAVEAAGIVAPDLLDQVIARIGSAGVGGEQVEQLELLRREVELQVADARGAADRIDRQVSLDGRFALRRRIPQELHPAEDRPYARQELADREGLGQVVVGSDLESEHAVYLFRASRQHQDWDDRLSTDPTRDLQAVEPRQHPIEDQQVWPIALDEVKRGLSVEGLDHSVALVLQMTTDQTGQIALVFGDQHRSHTVV